MGAQEILKKTASRSDEISKIVKSFRLKSKSFEVKKGRRDNQFLPQIARVYFMSSKYSLASALLDETQLIEMLEGVCCHLLFQQSHLSSFLWGPAREVLAIQVHLSGASKKASGTFYQTYESNKGADEAISSRFETFEFLESLDNTDVSIFTTASRKLLIHENQHELIKATTSKFIRFIETVTGTRVKSIVTQMAFNAKWVPFVQCVKSIVLVDTAGHYPSQSDRHNLIFPSGAPPILPSQVTLPPLLSPRSHCFYH